MSNSRRKFISRAAIAAAVAPFVSLTNTFGQGLTNALEKTPKVSPPSDLKITDVKCAFSGGGLFVKISTNQDLVGWGEGVDAVGGTYHLVERLGRQLIGRSPLTPNLFFEQFRKGAFFGGAQSGVFVAVISAFDAALWDLTGKALGLPIYQLLGGKFRDKVRVYCDTDMEDPLGAESDKKLPWIKDQGFTAMKIDLDDATDPNRFDRVNWTANNAEVDRMFSWVRHVRESIPKE